MRNLRILCYHDILPSGARRALSSGKYPTLDEFREQMVFLKERYRVVSLDDVSRHYQGGTSPMEFSVAVTFDDGAAGVMLAAPVLLDLGLPFTVFLSTRFIGSDELPWFSYLDAIVKRVCETGVPPAGPELKDAGKSDEFRKYAKASLVKLPYKGQMELLGNWAEATGTTLADIRRERQRFLSWNQVQELAAGGASFGSHTWSHLDLRTLSKADLEQEFSAARSDITEHLGPEHARFVAYPDGKFDQLVLAAARRYHSMGLADRYRYASWGDTLRLPRRGINQGGLAALKHGLSTRRELASWVKQRLRGILGIGYPVNETEPLPSDDGLAIGTAQAEK